MSGETIEAVKFFGVAKEIKTPVEKPESAIVIPEEEKSVGRIKKFQVSENQREPVSTRTSDPDLEAVAPVAVIKELKSTIAPEKLSEKVACTS